MSSRAKGNLIEKKYVQKLVVIFFKNKLAKFISSSDMEKNAQNLFLMLLRY